MMQSSFSTIGPLFFLLGFVHVLAALSVVVGIVMLLMWAFKHLSPAQLKKWGLIFVICGGVVSLVTMLSLSEGGYQHRGYLRTNGGGMMRGDVPPNGMMKQDADGNWSMNGGGMMRGDDDGSSSSAS